MTTMLRLRPPAGRDPEDLGERRGSGSVLLLALDRTALADALPVGLARAAAVGHRLTVAEEARLPWSWAFGPLSPMPVEPASPAELRAHAQAGLRRRVESLVPPGSSFATICHEGRPDRWLAEVAAAGGYATVIVATRRRLTERRRARLLGSLGRGVVGVVLPVASG
jgi:hypothetical protein